jgi:hypothetical protein
MDDRIHGVIPAKAGIQFQAAGRVHEQETRFPPSQE